MRHAPQEILVAQKNAFPGIAVGILQRRQSRRALFESFHVPAKSFLELKHLRAVEFRKIAGEVPSHSALATRVVKADRRRSRSFEFRVPSSRLTQDPRPETRDKGVQRRSYTSTFVPTFRSSALR